MCARYGDNWLYYFGDQMPDSHTLELPAEGRYKVDLIDPASARIAANAEVKTAINANMYNHVFMWGAVAFRAVLPRKYLAAVVSAELACHPGVARCRPGPGQTQGVARRAAHAPLSGGRRDGRLARPQKAILSPLVRRQSRLVADDN